MNEPNEMMIEIDRGIMMGRTGDREGARTLFTALWTKIGEKGDPFHRCALAHSMADVQDDPHEELDWDLRALEAANSIKDDSPEKAGSGPVSGFYPSLHLNLGEAYRKVGNLEQARHHLSLGRACIGNLGNSDYATMIDDGFNRLEVRIENVIL